MYCSACAMNRKENYFCILSLLLFIQELKAFSVFRHRNFHFFGMQLKGAINEIDFASKEQRISVAVIGGGVAGLSCASHLTESGVFLPTVFDTGRLRIGGRCSSRLPSDPLENYKSGSPLLNNFIIDHAAQMISVSSDLASSSQFFAKQIEEWEEEGVITKFPSGSVVEILPDKENNSFCISEVNGESSSVNFFHGTNGMGSIPLAISNSAFPIEQDIWISPSNGVKYIKDASTSRKRWRLQEKGKEIGDYDFLIIAHNGKCADRLMSKTPAKAFHSLLRTNFSPTCPNWGGNRMTLNSIYSLSFVIHKKSSPLVSIFGSKDKNSSFIISAFIKNQSNLSFLSCSSHKYPIKHVEHQNLEVWTLFSSSKFAKKYKGPQENLPIELKNNVTSIMLQSLEQSLQLSADSLSCVILEARLQLWGAAVPLNTWTGRSREKQIKGKNEYINSRSSEQSHVTHPPGFLYDGKHCVGACGDWLLDPSIYGAWESGRRLANWLVKNKNDLDSSSISSIGLPPNGSFKCSQNAMKDIIGSV